MTKPVLTLAEPIPARTAADFVTLRFSASEPATVECRLDDDLPLQVCTSNTRLAVPEGEPRGGRAQPADHGHRSDGLRRPVPPAPAPAAPAPAAAAPAPAANLAAPAAPAKAPALRVRLVKPSIVLVTGVPARAIVKVTVGRKTKTVTSRRGGTVLVKVAPRRGAKVTVRVGKVTKRLKIR